MKIVTIRPASAAFQEGDGVVLVRGSYQGARGTFLRFRTDPKWADVAETNGNTRQHPVEWMAHSPREAV